jgi:hypothetical protein
MRGRLAATLAVAVVVSSAGCTIDDDQERAIGQTQRRRWSAKSRS